MNGNAEERMISDIAYIRTRVDELYAMTNRRSLANERRVSKLEERTGIIALLVSAGVSALAMLLK